jgi:hypothetical protein
LRLFCHHVAGYRIQKERHMRKVGKTWMFVLLAAVTLMSWRLYAAAARAKEPEPQVWTPGCIASVPRSWGVYRGGSAQSGLTFEDGAGTLRFLTNLPCDGSTAVVALEIRRTGGPSGSNQ